MSGAMYAAVWWGIATNTLLAVACWAWGTADTHRPDPDNHHHTKEQPMRAHVLATVLAALAAALAWPVYVAATLTTRPHRKRRTWPEWRHNAWAYAYNAWFDHDRAGHRARATAWGAITDRIAS